MIEIKNKLEVRPGGVVQIPGCEPISSTTSTELARNLTCKCSVIDYKKVLELIPGSKLVRVTYPQGQVSTGMFIELPSGPPPIGNECPSTCLEDWYKLLKDSCNPTDEPDEITCSGFNFTGCCNNYDPNNHPKDPNLRPNSKPL